MRMRRLARIARDQILNYYHHQYRFVPTNLCIETTTLCNAGCVYCARFKTELPGPNMDFELFKAVVDASAEFITDNAMPYSRGEPLMYPHIIEAIQYITDAGLKGKMYSNGALMTEEMSYKVLNAGLTELSFSIDDNDPKYFEEVRGLPWERVLKNIEGVVRIRDEIGVDCKIVTRGAVGPWNEERIADIKRFWEERVDESRWMPLLPMPDKSAMEDCPTYHLPPYECAQPYLALNVRIDGTMVFCCNDWHDQLVVGKIDKTVTKRKILDIYNNKEMGRLRNALEFGKGAPLLCAYCQSDRRANKMWDKLADQGLERGKTLKVE